jgi:hypothetical protein
VGRRLTPEQSTGPIRRALRVLLVSEVGGIESFAGAARGSGRGDREMWEALHALEVQTKAAADEHLGDLVEEFARSEAAAEVLGKASGVALSHLPKRLQMQALTSGTKPFMPFFLRLEDHFADTPDGSFFSYVVAHERAISDVGRRMREGRDEPLRKVEELLNGPWAR